MSNGQDPKNPFKKETEIPGQEPSVFKKETEIPQASVATALTIPFQEEEEKRRDLPIIPSFSTPGGPIIAAITQPRITLDDVATEA